MAYQIKRTDTYIADYNTSKTEYILPKDPYTGSIYYIRWIQPTGFTVNGNGKKINVGTKLVDIADSRAGQGDLNIFVFDGYVWLQNYCPR